MAHQRLITLRQIILGVAVQIAERRRQAVATMLLRHAAKRPKSILQALGQRDETLAAEHDMRVLEARERQTEVIEPVAKYDPGDGDAERARVSEVRQAETARLMLLTKDHILLGAAKRAPRSHAPFQRASDRGADLGMTPPDLFQHGNRANARRCLQHRHDLCVPDGGKWIGAPSAALRRFLRRQARILLDPVAGRGAEAGLGGSDGRVVGLSVNHVKPHLVVGYVEAGQCLIPR